MADCTSCTGGLRNTGILGGKKIAGAVKQIMFMQLVANDGTVNGITLADLDYEDISNLINHADPSKRLYPFPLLENYQSVRDDAIFQEFESRNRRLVAEGNKPVTFLVPDAPYGYKQVADKLNCTKVGFFVVDLCGDISGGKTVSGKFLPIPIMERSLTSKLNQATETDVQALMVNFLVSNRFNDTEMQLLSCNEITAVDGFPTNVLDFAGLINLVGSTPAYSNTNQTITVEVRDDLGTAKGGQLVEGIGALLEVVQSPSTVETTTVVEISPGVYAFTKGSALSGTNFVRLKSTAKGFDDTELKNKTAAV